MKQFLTALQAGLVLFAMAMSGAGWASDGKMKSASPGDDDHARDALVPQADDLTLVQHSLNSASFE